MFFFSMTSVPSFTSKSNMYFDNEPLDPMDDDISECSNLEAEFALSMQLQMASMLAFAYIWSLGAFIPLRYGGFIYNQVHSYMYYGCAYILYACTHTHTQ